MTPRHRAPARLALLAVAMIVAGGARQASSRLGNGVAVRFAEGSLHGLLELRTATGEYLASGDLLQRLRDSTLESRMTFRFADSSYFDEQVEFTQRHVFGLVSYHLVQRGPAFPRDLDARFDRSGNYVVSAKDRDGKTDHWQGRFDDLPSDTYNGIVIVAAKNLPPGGNARVHIVAFTPKPRMIGLELTPEGRDRLILGRRTGTATRYVFKPKLGTLLRIGATITGQVPPDSHTWILPEDVPAFVRFQGPLYSGPAWRIDVINAEWPRDSATAAPAAPRTNR